MSRIKIKLIILLVILVLLIGGGIYFWLRAAGIIKIGAEVIIGCQGSRQISSFLGKPGSNLVTYNLFGQEVSIHQMVAPSLDQIQKEVNEANTGYNFNDVQTFNVRPKIWGGGQSLHSWGIAIDINPATNPYQRGNYGPPQTDIPQEIIDIFKRYGFAWGGDWPGQRDAMHFEWYGVSISGQVIDQASLHKVLSVATDVDGVGSPNVDGGFNWIVPFGNHIITAKARGYKDNSFGVSLACFSDTTMDIALESLPSNVAGSITGKVKVAQNYPLLMPANIYLDSRLVGITNVIGDYYIPNVHEGDHEIKAKVLFFPGGSRETKIYPGENLQNVDIIIGK